MPKKRSSLQYAKPSVPTHPSLSTHSTSASASSAASVNDKLQKLRLEGRSTSTPKSGQNVQRSSAVPAHPSVERALQMDPTPPPRPRPGLRVRGGRRGPPGPPPPGSWLQRQQVARKEVQTFGKRRDARLDPFPGIEIPKSGTLFDQTLRSLAKNWDELSYYNQNYLAAIPIRLKELLLHYLANHCEKGIDAEGLELLFLDEIELLGGTGAKGLTHLDVSVSIGSTLSLKDLRSFFTAPSAQTSESATAETPDTWDSVSLSISPPPAAKFASVTHLSLAHPLLSISWEGLLKLAPHMPQLTHLSLAQWPRPALAPNSSTAYVSTPSGNAQYGASHFYSELDQDYNEAASVLRQLSKHTICLEWLDLTGCFPWTKCLKCRSVDWCGAWAGLQTVKIGQGHVPNSIRDLPWDGLFQNSAAIPFSSNTLELNQLSIHQIDYLFTQCDEAMTRNLLDWVLRENDLKNLSRAILQSITLTNNEHKPEDAFATKDDDWTTISTTKSTRSSVRSKKPKIEWASLNADLEWSSLKAVKRANRPPLPDPIY